MTKKQYKTLLRKKAMQSISRHKVSAIGLNAKGEAVMKSFNHPRFDRKGGGIHAEMKIMQTAKRKNIKTILICRVNVNGGFLPIDPCPTCRAKADELGIKIVSI